MSFQPTIPAGGLVGWRFLERTGAAQRAAFEKGPELARDVAYFRENIGKITSAEALVKDRRLLKVALGAFGLEDELDKRAFIRQVLESDLDDPRSLARRLTQPAFRAMAEAFGFAGAGGAQTAAPGFAERMVEQYKVRQFEVAVGGVDDTMRLALNFRREIASLAESDGPAAWFNLLASKPMRRVVELALGLPKEFAGIDIDRQRDILRDRTRGLCGEGSLAVFKDPKNVEKLLTRFFARAQIEQGPSTATSPALQLLQASSGRDSLGLLNLLAARR